MDEEIDYGQKVKNYIVLSRFPPPLGGVSVFAQRKVAQLVRHGQKVDVIDLGSTAWLVRLFQISLAKRSGCYLVNTMHPLLLLMLLVLRVLDRCVLFDHNHSRHFLKNPIKRRLFAFIVRRVKKVVIVHEHLRSFYENSGISFQVQSPFIPPDASREKSIVNNYPRWVGDFYEDTCCVRLLNSAWRYVEVPGSGDLYGVDITLRLLKCFQERGIPVRLAFAFGDYNQNDIPKDTLEMINSLMTSGVLYILSGQHEIWPLFSRVDLFLRTTATDGESVSVLEALYFGCPVVASDVVPRPDGVLTYKHRHVESLYGEVMKAIASKEWERDLGGVASLEACRFAGDNSLREER